MRHFAYRGVVFYQFQVVEQRSAPLLGFARGAVGLDYLLKRTQFGHQLTPWLDQPLPFYMKLGSNRGGRTCYNLSASRAQYNAFPLKKAICISAKCELPCSTPRAKSSP